MKPREQKKAINAINNNNERSDDAKDKKKKRKQKTYRRHSESLNYISIGNDNTRPFTRSPSLSCTCAHSVAHFFCFVELFKFPLFEQRAERRKKKRLTDSNRCFVIASKQNKMNEQRARISLSCSLFSRQFAFRFLCFVQCFCCFAWTFQ